MTTVTSSTLEMDSGVEKMGETRKRKSLFKCLKKLMHRKSGKKKKKKDAFDCETTDQRSNTLSTDSIFLGDDLGTQKNITFNCNGDLNIYIGEGRGKQLLNSSQNTQSGGCRSMWNSEAKLSREESSFGSSGSTQVEIGGLINRYESSDDESDSLDYDYTQAYSKSKDEFYLDNKRALKTDLEKVRNDIVCFTHAKSYTEDKHMDTCESSIAFSCQEKRRCKTWGSMDFAKAEQEVLHSADSGYVPSNLDENKIYELSKPQAHETLLESEDTCEDSTTAQKWNDLNRECNGGLSKESNMTLTTFDRDITNVKPYSGQPELDPHQQMEELMEDSQTTPKEHENSMHLQKVVENMPLPDPVASHEETHLKLDVCSSQMAEHDNKASSYEFSSGYPVKTCSSRTEKKPANGSSVSWDTEWSIISDWKFSAEFVSPKLENIRSLKISDSSIYSTNEVDENNVGACVELPCTSINNGQGSDQLGPTESRQSDVCSVETVNNIEKEQICLKSSASASLSMQVKSPQGHMQLCALHDCWYFCYYALVRSAACLYKAWCVETATSKLIWENEDDGVSDGSKYGTSQDNIDDKETLQLSLCPYPAHSKDDPGDLEPSDTHEPDLGLTHGQFSFMFLLYVYQYVNDMIVGERKEISLTDCIRISNIEDKEKILVSLKIRGTEVEAKLEIDKNLCCFANEASLDILTENECREAKKEEKVLSDDKNRTTEKERNPTDNENESANLYVGTVDISFGNSNTEKLDDITEDVNEDFCGQMKIDNGGPDAVPKKDMQNNDKDQSMYDNINITDEKATKNFEKDLSKVSRQLTDSIDLGTTETEHENAENPLNFEDIEAIDEYKPAHIQATKDSGFEDADVQETNVVLDKEKDIYSQSLLFSKFLDIIHNEEAQDKPCQAEDKILNVEYESDCVEALGDHLCDKRHIDTYYVKNSTGRSVKDESTDTDHTEELDPYETVELMVDQSIEGKCLGHTQAELCHVLKKKNNTLLCSDNCKTDSPPQDHSATKKKCSSGMKKGKKVERKKEGKMRNREGSLDREILTRNEAENQRVQINRLENIYVKTIQLKEKCGSQISGDYANEDTAEPIDSDVNDTATRLIESSQQKSEEQGFNRAKKGRKRRNKFFCRYCHQSRKKPNKKCFNHDMYDPQTATIKKIVQRFEQGNIRSDQEGTESVFGETSTGFDSGVFSEFASQVSSYTSSYDSLKKLFETCHQTGKAAKAGSRKHNQKLLRSNRVTSLRSLEEGLRKFLRQITSSWSYFGPESYSPYLYPGLASYFDRTRDGNQLSDRERYSYEWIRFQSFDQYGGNGSGIVLARNGFYHDRNAGPTATRCYACGATYSEWQFFDDNESHHRPDCPLHTGINTGNIPIQHDGDNDMHAPALGIVRDTEPGNNDVSATSEASCTKEAIVSTNVADTAHTGATSCPPSVDMLASSMEQARIGSQNGERTSMQPTQDRENEQYLSSYAAHRDNSQDSLSTSQSSQSSNRSSQNEQSSEAANAPSNLATGLTQHSPHRSPVLGHAGFGQGAMGGTPSGAASSNRDTGSPHRLPRLGHAGFGYGAMGGTPSGAAIDPTPLSQPVTVSSPTAPSQLATSGQPLTARLNTQGIQASAEATPRYLETPGQIQIHPELIHVDSPKHPEYATVEARADTFRGAWPANLDQTPRRMAEAGFFYTGVADFTRCFACGGGLRNWEAGDDPVIEHTRWYPTCPYINQLKGEKYVQAVTKKQQQHLEEKRKQQQNLTQQRAAQQHPPDPMRTGAASILVEMGYPQDKIKDAILAVRRQTGKVEVTGEQALIWILDDEERRNAIAARRAEGSAAFASSPASPAVEASSSTSSTSSVATTVATATSSTSTEPRSQTTGSQTSTAGSQQPTGNQPSGGTQSQPSESARNQQGAAGGGNGTERGESPKPSGGKSKKKRKKRGGQPASLPAEGASGNSGDLAPPAATQSLREENEKLRDIQTCKICLDKPVDTTFLPCGHLVCCGNCAHKLRKCPICRKLIKGSVKTFMS